MILSQKSYPFCSCDSDEKQGLVHAVVSIFNTVDAHGDVVYRGAFARSICEAKKRGRFPPGVFYHDWKQPVAKTLEAWEDEEGLHVMGQFNLETQRGRETFSDIRAGIISEYSFGFQVVKEERISRGRAILDVDWYEWSPVLMGANRLTYTADVKGVGYERLSRERLELAQGLLRHQVDVVMVLG